MNNRLQTIFETLSHILNENQERLSRRAERGRQEVAIAKVVLGGPTSPGVTRRAERLARTGQLRTGWGVEGSPIMLKAARLLKAREEN